MTLRSHLSSSTSQVLAEGFQTFVADDADDHAANLTGWNQLYDQLAPGRFHGVIRELWIGKLQLFSEFTSHRVRQSCQAWPNSWWFGIPLQDESETRLGCTCIDKGSVAVRSGSTDFDLLTPDDFEILGVVVDQEELAEYIEVTGRTAFRSTDAGCLLRVGGQHRMLARNLFHQILSEAAKAPVVLEHQASLQAIRCSILETLVGLCSSPVGSVRSSSTHISRHSLVSEVREYALSKKDQPVMVPDVCRRFYITPRTLQNAFHDVLGVSPASYLRMIRLNGIRRMLRDRSSRVSSIQDAAAAWGFWHLSQFAHDYKKLFGELPSDSLRQSLRGDSREPDCVS